MHIAGARIDPLRKPNWRGLRVFEMVRGRPRPLSATRFDDPFIRTYRLLLLGLSATHARAAQSEEIIQRYPHAYHAHRLNYSEDVFPQQILMARLLTRETFSEIAARVGVEPMMIETYGALFYDVRDRLDCRDWIAITMRGNFEPVRTQTEKDLLELRGYILRLFAYFGGPLVLDAAIQGFAATPPPQNSSEVAPWLEKALEQVTTTKAIAAVMGMSAHAPHVMRLLQLARKQRAPAKEDDPEELAKVRKIVEVLQKKTTPEPSGEMPPTKPSVAKSAVGPEPKTTSPENGRMSASLTQAVGFHDEAQEGETKTSALDGMMG